MGEFVPRQDHQALQMRVKMRGFDGSGLRDVKGASHSSDKLADIGQPTGLDTGARCGRREYPFHSHACQQD